MFSHAKKCPVIILLIICTKFTKVFGTATVGTICVSQVTGDIGSCIGESKCIKDGGKVDGTCEDGLSSCCIVISSCNSVIKQNRTSFRNPNGISGFNPTTPSVCNVRLQRPTEKICQVRLDFIKMELAGTNDEGNCLVDQLIISGINIGVQKLCGSLSGQHMYLDFEGKSRITLNIITDGSTDSSTRYWDVLITYFTCNSLTKAPDGCLQYFREPIGEVQMLGYPMAPHLANLDYTVCIRPDADAQSIVWTPCPNEPILTRFLMSGSPPTNTSQLNSPLLCPNDFVMIMSSDETISPVKSNDRYCGSGLGLPGFVTPNSQIIRSLTRPYILRVRTDRIEIQNRNEELQDFGNTGFCLAYMQEINN